jgi:hypothetical protein
MHITLVILKNKESIDIPTPDFKIQLYLPAEKQKINVSPDLAVL